MALQKIMRMHFKESKMNKFKILFILVIAMALGGCTNMSQTQQSTTSGALGGAALGAVVGAIAGNAGMGAAIGAAAGGTGGYLYGKHKESEQDAYERGRKDQYNQQQYR